jgi:glutamine amidotransferase
LIAQVTSGDFAYFANSYYCVPDDDAHILAQTEYGGLFTSVVAHENIYGIQFHPEKSQKVGLQILENFSKLLI